MPYFKAEMHQIRFQTSAVGSGQESSTPNQLMVQHNLPATDKHADEVGCTFLQSPAVASQLPNEDCVAD